MKYTIIILYTLSSSFLLNSDIFALQPSFDNDPMPKVSSMPKVTLLNEFASLSEQFMRDPLSFFMDKSKNRVISSAYLYYLPLLDLNYVGNFKIKIRNQVESKKFIELFDGIMDIVSTKMYDKYNVITSYFLVASPEHISYIDIPLNPLEKDAKYLLTRYIKGCNFIVTKVKNTANLRVFYDTTSCHKDSYDLSSDSFYKNGYEIITSINLQELTKDDPFSRVEIFLFYKHNLWNMVYGVYSYPGNYKVLIKEKKHVIIY